MTEPRRGRIERVRAALVQRGSPRAEMMLITLCTGAAGFLTSYGLLQCGLERLWFRYLLALLVAYGVFFGLLRLWVSLHARRSRRDDGPSLEEVADLTEGLAEAALSETPGSGGALEEGARFGGGGATARIEGPSATAVSGGSSGGSASSGADLLDGDEIVLPIVVVLTLVGALLASGWVVYSAPGLLAEMLVDGALVGGLYRRLRRDNSASWFSIALRQTLLPFLATALLFVIAGWYLQSRLPEARSLGDVVRHLRAAP
jgi:hypothetical protein